MKVCRRAMSRSLVKIAVVGSSKTDISILELRKIFFIAFMYVQAISFVIKNKPSHCIDHSLFVSALPALDIVSLPSSLEIH